MVKIPFVFNLLKQYTYAMENGWNEANDARNWFIAPYSFGSNEFINNKFPNEQFNMYTHKKGLDETDNNQSYNNYNPVAFSFHQMSRFYLSERLNFEVYKNLIKWFKAFNRLNPENKNKWSEIEDKSKLENASINLVKTLIKYLDWHHLLLGEFEDPSDKKNTLADLFAMKAFDDNKIDFEYTYRFAYEFLYEKLVPTMIANDWVMPDEFDNFEKNLIDTNRKDSYIYDYIFKYLNVIFKDKFPDINLLEKRKTYLNITNKDFWKQKFLDNVLKHWNYQFKINVKTNEF
ncbi:CDS14 family ICE transfer lipoprotein [Mycoplasmopsis adleri]|uniref:CDS14 family ICE transfer lipoprotein n=1 Tax=Mycoplasmopsis adleri TaxID=51362 RepID=UPI00387311FA